MSYTINSVTFKRPLFKNTFLSVALSTASDKVETVKLPYLARINECVFSEVLELPPSDRDYLVFEIIGTDVISQGDQSATKQSLIAKKTIIASELYSQTSALKEVIIDFGEKDKNKAILCLETSKSLTPSPESAMTIVNSNRVQESKLNNWIEELKEDLKQMGGKDIDADLQLLTMGELYKQFIKNLTPVVYAYNFLSDIVRWKNEFKTTVVFIVGGVMILNAQLALFFTSLTILICHQKLIDVTLNGLRKTKTQQARQQKFRQYKNNLLFIQEFMRYSNLINKEVKRMIKNEDRTFILTIFKKIRAYQIIILISCLFLNMNHMLCAAYWILLIKMNPTFWPIFVQFDQMWFSLTEMMFSKLRNNIQQVKMRQLQQIVPDEQKKDKSRKRTFIKYENERWWLFGGWTKKMLIGERSNFSDVQGKIDRSSNDIPLPGSDWQWTSAWSLEKGEQTDSEGWQYNGHDWTAEGWTPVRNTLKHYIRRRRWSRSCVQQ